MEAKTFALSGMSSSDKEALITKNLRHISFIIYVTPPRTIQSNISEKQLLFQNLSCLI